MMSEFWDKHQSEITEKMALKLIHSKLHRVLKEYKENKSYVVDLLNIHCMVEDLLKAKGADLPHRK